MEKVKEKNEWIGWVKAIGLAVMLAFVIRFFLFVPIVVEGSSMMPTLEEDDIVVVNKIGAKFVEYNRFDVIVLNQTKKHIISSVLSGCKVII